MRIPFGNFVTRTYCQSCRLNSTLTTHRQRCRVVRLAYDVVQGTPGISPIVVLHGLFGSKHNWTTLAKKIHRETQRTILTVDVRNHGESEHADGMSMEVMRDDLLLLMRKELQVDQFTLIGHSLGGRCAMVTALSQPQLIEKLIVVDVSPVRIQGGFNIPAFVSAMKAVQFDQSVTLSQNRKNAGKQLEGVIKEEGLLQFILTNVVERDGRCQWRLNLDGIEAGLQDLTADLPTFSSTYTGPVLFVRGGNSDYVRMEHLPAIRKLFPTATISTVEGAGHFVHADKPKEFLDVVLSFLRS